jgi:GAF domain-containing protein
MEASSDKAGSDPESTQARTRDEDADLAASLRELSELANGDLSLRALLTKVAEYAVQAIPGAEGAGLTLIAADRSETLVATSQLVSDVDAIQYGIRQGPCITAAHTAKTVLSHSLSEDDRWPVFGKQVAELGVHSALSLPLIAADQVVGAMNIYARHRGAFDDRSTELGQLFAAPAAIAVQNAQVLSQALALAADLQSAFSDRAVIDRAIGLLIGRDKISAAAAESWMHASAEAHGLTVLEVADITLGEWARRQLGEGSPSDLP